MSYSYSSSGLQEALTGTRFKDLTDLNTLITNFVEGPISGGEGGLPGLDGNSTRTLKRQGPYITNPQIPDSLLDQAENLGYHIIDDAMKNFEATQWVNVVCSPQRTDKLKYLEEVYLLDDNPAETVSLSAPFRIVGYSKAQKGGTAHFRGKAFKMSYTTLHSEEGRKTWVIFQHEVTQSIKNTLSYVVINKLVNSTRRNVSKVYLPERPSPEQKNQSIIDYLSDKRDLIDCVRKKHLGLSEMIRKVGFLAKKWGGRFDTLIVDDAVVFGQQFKESNNDFNTVGQSTEGFKNKAYENLLDKTNICNISGVNVFKVDYTLPFRHMEGFNYTLQQKIAFGEHFVMRNRYVDSQTVFKPNFCSAAIYDENSGNNTVISFENAMNNCIMFNGDGKLHEYERVLLENTLDEVSNTQFKKFDPFLKENDSKNIEYIGEIKDGLVDPANTSLKNSTFLNYVCKSMLSVFNISGDSNDNTHNVLRRGIKIIQRLSDVEFENSWISDFLRSNNTSDSIMGRKSVYKFNDAIQNLKVTIPKDGKPAGFGSLWGLRYLVQKTSLFVGQELDDARNFIHLFDELGAHLSNTIPNHELLQQKSAPIFLTNPSVGDILWANLFSNTKCYYAKINTVHPYFRLDNIDEDETPTLDSIRPLLERYYVSKKKLDLLSKRFDQHIANAGIMIPVAVANRMNLSTIQTAGGMPKRMMSIGSTFDDVFECYQKNEIYSSLSPYLSEEMNDKLFKYLEYLPLDQAQLIHDKLPILMKDTNYLENLGSIANAQIRDQQQALALFDLNAILTTNTIDEMIDESINLHTLHSKHDNMAKYLAAVLIVCCLSHAYIGGDDHMSENDLHDIVHKAKEYLGSVGECTDVFGYIEKYKHLNELPFDTPETMELLANGEFLIRRANVFTSKMLDYDATTSKYILSILENTNSIDEQQDKDILDCMLSCQFVFRLLYENFKGINDHNAILTKLKDKTLDQCKTVYNECMQYAKQNKNLLEIFTNWNNEVNRFKGKHDVKEEGGRWVRTPLVVSDKNLSSLLRCYQSIPNADIRITISSNYNDDMVVDKQTLKQWSTKYKTSLNEGNHLDIGRYSTVLDYAMSDFEVLNSKSLDLRKLGNIGNLIRENRSRISGLFKEFCAKNFQNTDRSLCLFYLLIEFTRENIVNLCNSSIQPPVEVVLFRPLQTYESACGVLCTSGNDCIASFWGNPFCSVNTDGANRQMYCGVSVSMGTIILREENIHMQRGMQIIGYHGGCGTSFYTYNGRDRNSEIPTNLSRSTFRLMSPDFPSLISVIVKIGSVLPEIVSISGRFNQFNLSDSEVSRLHYSTAGRISNHLDVSSLPIFSGNEDDMINDDNGNFAMYRGTTYYADVNGVFSDLKYVDAGNSVWPYELDRPGYKSFRTGKSVNLPITLNKF